MTLREAALRNLFKRSLVPTAQTVRSAHSQAVTSLSLFSERNNRSRWLLSSGLDGRVALYDVSRSQRTVVTARNSARPQSADMRPSAVTSIGWYPVDPGAFLSTTAEGSLNVWDTEKFASVSEYWLENKIYCHKVRCSTLAGAGSLVVMGTTSSDVRFCDLGAAAGQCTRRISGAHDSGVTCVDWHPFEDHVLLTASLDGSMKLWDIRNYGYGPMAAFDCCAMESSSASQSSKSFIQREHERSDLKQRFAHTASIMSARFSSCGNFVISCGNDKKIRMWNRHTGALMPCALVRGISSTVPYQMCFASVSDGITDDILLTPGSHNSIVAQSLREFGGGSFVAGSPGHMGAVSGLVYDRNSMEAFSSGLDGLILTWQMNSSCDALTSSMTNRPHLLEGAVCTSPPKLASLSRLCWPVYCPPPAPATLANEAIESRMEGVPSSSSVVNTLDFGSDGIGRSKSTTNRIDDPDMRRYSELIGPRGSDILEARQYKRIRRIKTTHSDMNIGSSIQFI